MLIKIKQDNMKKGSNSPAEKDGKIGGAIGTALGTAAGGIGGFFLGGPAGAISGAKAGAGIGGNLGGNIGDSVDDRRERLGKGQYSIEKGGLGPQEALGNMPLQPEYTTNIDPMTGQEAITTKLGELMPLAPVNRAGTPVRAYKNITDSTSPFKMSANSFEKENKFKSMAMKLEDLSGDDKITKKDFLIGAKVIDKEGNKL